MTVHPVVRGRSAERLGGYWVVLCAGGLLASLLPAYVRTIPAADERPHILIIVVDDMGYSDLGCYGSEIQTPNIDALAAGGLRFTQFYNTAKCYTTRASLLTGLYHQQALDGKILNRQGATIAEVLRTAGYRTLMSGKWHLNGEQLENPAFQPLSRGFERFFGTILGAGSYFDPYTLQRGYERIKAEAGFYYTDAITEDAIQALREYGSRGKLFQYVGYTAPHWPMQIPSDDTAIDKYRKLYSQGWDAIRRQRYQRQLELGVIHPKVALSPRDSGVAAWSDEGNVQWQIQRMSVYAAMLERLDRGVGRIVEELRRQDILDETLILFLSDNGGSAEDIGFQNGLNTLGGNQFTRDGRKIQIGREPEVLPGGPESYQGVGREWANVNDTPFRMFKTWSHEGGIATPLIAHWPTALRNAGSINPQVGHVIDIMPTCLDVADVAYPDSLNGHALLPCEGQSLVRAFEGQAITPRTLYWEFGNHAAVRDGQWKLVAPSIRERNWELYDMAVDRSELNNRIEDRPQRAQRMAAMFDHWAKRVGANLKVKKTKTKATAAAAKVSPGKTQASIEAKKKAKAKSSEAAKPAAAEQPARILYRNNAYTLMSDAITEGSRQAEVVGGARPHLINCNAEMVRPNLHHKYPTVQTKVPLIDVLYRVALSDLEMNIVEDERGRYFRVSPDFPNMIFTRDTAYSSQLGAAYVLPDVVKSHLRIARKLRRKLKFRCPLRELIPFPGVQNEPEPLGNFDFFRKYGTNAYARRTDDPVWVLGYWKAICAAGSQDEVPWMIDEFEYFDQHFYRLFFDEADGLYFGQASFIDIGGTGYPSEYEAQDSLRVKALSTNCLYVAALDRVARGCQLIGRTSEAAKYQERATDLRNAIRRQFRHPEGYFAYFKAPDGRLEPRREQLGMAFAVLFDVVAPGQFAAVVDGHPINDYGSPTIFPFYDGSKVYHNRAIWPFADTFFHMALQKRHRQSAAAERVLLRNLGNLSRNALWGNFAELLDYETGGWKKKHARSYIWSASAYLSVVFHMLAGIDVEDGRAVRFAPHLPKVLGGQLKITDLRLGGMQLELDITGHGRRIEHFAVDGHTRSEPVLPMDGGHHQIAIKLMP